MRAKSRPGAGEVGRGGTSPEFSPAWVINQGFPQDQRCLPPTRPPLLPPCLVDRAGAWTVLAPRNGLGGRPRTPPAPREAAPPNPRWEIPAAAAAAGSGREKGAGRRGRRLPVGAGTKPQLRLLCPFQTAFVPITSGPAAPPEQSWRAPRGAEALAG